jgi:hypothetical protein
VTVTLDGEVDLGDGAAAGPADGMITWLLVAVAGLGRPLCETPASRLAVRLAVVSDVMVSAHDGNSTVTSRSSSSMASAITRAPGRPDPLTTPGPRFGVEEHHATQLRTGET